MALQSRLAIICGGAGGIGTAIGQTLSKQGASLALLYAPSESSQIPSLRSTAYPATADITPYPCDITSASSVDATFAAIAENSTAFPAMLVNAAGYISLNPMETFDAEESAKHYAINLQGPTLCSAAFARTYLAAKAKTTNPPPGRIVSIASQAAHVALLNHGPYCASKAGLLGLTRCMAAEWGPQGITANSVSPGPVMTEMGKKAWADAGAREAYLREVPTGRFVEPGEVAGTVGWLCGDGAGSVNGEDVKVEGGYCIR